MDTRKITIGVHLGRSTFDSWTRERGRNIYDFLRDKKTMNVRILLTLTDYLIKYSTKYYFDKVDHYFDSFILHTNGTLEGWTGEVNKSRVDIIIPSVVISEGFTKLFDFSYPWQLYFMTFMTRKPDYEPHLFSILQVFSISVWTAIVSVLVMMILFYYMTFKKRNSLNKIFLHVFSVLLRQGSIMKPSLMAEKVLNYAWMFGAMFICLAYESVILSFLSIPPITEIKDWSQLARSVEKGTYHCITRSDTFSKNNYWNLQFENKYLRLIGSDLERNILYNKYKDVYNDLFRKRSKQNFAYIGNTLEIDMLARDDDFVSDDRVLESMSAIMIRKDFCCKKIIDSFVHKMMASGLYFKYYNDGNFYFQQNHLPKYEKKDTSNRKLNLTDLAPAFFFLLTGYLVSLLVFIGEMLLSRLKKEVFFQKRNKNLTKITTTV